MDIVAVFLAIAHLVGCLFVAFVGLLVIGLGENRTPDEQAEAERLGWLMIALLALGIAMVILLGFRRALLAGVAFVVQVVLGVLVLLGIDASFDGLWLYVFTLGIPGTAAGMLLATASLRARDRRLA
jgi:hypothetical protein